LNASLLRIAIPSVLNDEMDRTQDPDSAGAAIATRTIKDIPK